MERKSINYCLKPVCFRYTWVDIPSIRSTILLVRTSEIWGENIQPCFQGLNRYSDDASLQFSLAINCHPLCSERKSVLCTCCVSLALFAGSANNWFPTKTVQQSALVTWKCWGLPEQLGKHINSLLFLFVQSTKFSPFSQTWSLVRVRSCSRKVAKSHWNLLLFHWIFLVLFTRKVN